jgi:hypothetical protein
MQVSQANRARWVPGAAGASFIYRLYDIGARTEPWDTPAAIFLGVENSPSTKTLNFLSVRKEAIVLMSLVANSNPNNLYSRPECHVVAKAISICKNTAASTYYCWNLRWRDPTASYIEVPYCDVLECQTNLHSASFFPRCIFGLSLESANQIILP